MRRFYLFVFAILIGAVALPFYLKGPGGTALFNTDSFFATPELPSAPQEVFKWRDAQGVWQFGDSPPEGVSAQKVAIRPNLSPIKTDWGAELEALEAEKAQAEAAKAAAAQQAAQEESGMPNLSDVYSPQAIEQAKEAAGLVDDHHQRLEEVMKLTKGKR